MAGSPFEIFRRNQRQMMVVLTGLAMFAFVFLDSLSMQSGQLPRSLGVILVAMLCAGGLWIVGAPRGKGGELALYGALIGGVVAFFGLGASGQAPVVSTNIGNFTREDLMRGAQRRSIANRFLVSAAKGGREQFGYTDDDSIVQRAVLLHQAKERGVQVSDEAVNEYISAIADQKLSTNDYKTLLRDLGITEAELFNVLREELQAAQVLAMDLPPAVQANTGPIQTPLTYWKQYKMLQVRQALDVVAVPVSEFVAKVPEPNDAELQQFFDRYKNQLPTPQGEPGFLVNRQVNLAYVAADFEVYEKQAPEPTDAEVVNYYEENKDRYRVLDLPEGAGDLMQETPAEAGPASATEPENGLPAAPSEAAAAPAEATPESAPQPVEAPEPAPAPAKEEGAAPAADSPAPESAAKSDTTPFQLVSFQDPEAAAQPAAAATTPDAATADPAVTESPAAPETTPPPAPAEATPALDLPLPPGPTSADGLPPAPGTPKEPKYRDLDDDLKLEIKETMLKDRTFEAMGNAVDRAYNEMTKYADEYLGVLEPAEQTKAAEDITKRLKAYAELNQLQYVETGLMTGQDLMASVDEPIGSAVEPTSNPFQRGASVVQQVFANDALYYPRRADSMVGGKRYAYWKIADVEPRVPSLTEVKDQVVRAWKEFQARPLAEKRAKELAELVTKAAKPVGEALSGQTINGATDGTPISVRETPRFSWMSMPRNLPFQFNPMFMPPPTISLVDGVDGAGEDFMKTVFEELSPNQTGVAANQSRSVYYVAHVKQRDATPSEGADNLGLKALQQQFLTEGKAGFENGPYMYLGRDGLMKVMEGWRKSYEKTYGILKEATLAEATPEK
jgi:hypothetical protein